MKFPIGDVRDWQTTGANSCLRIDYDWVEAEAKLDLETPDSVFYGYSQDQLLLKMVATGTWPVPILLVRNPAGDLTDSGREPLQSPVHLLEGHKRLGFLNAFIKDGKAVHEHLVWFVAW